MTVFYYKGARAKLRKKQSEHKKSYGPGSFAADYPDDLSASINYPVSL